MGFSRQEYWSGVPLPSPNRPTTRSQIETVIRNIPANKSPGPDNFTAEFYQKFREDQTGIKIAREISITSDMQMTPPLWQKVKRN